MRIAAEDVAGKEKMRFDEGHIWDEFVHESDESLRGISALPFTASS
jgi:hypothetical protein